MRDNELGPDRGTGENDASGIFDNLHASGSLDPSAAVQANGQELPIMSPHFDLMSLRAQFPFLEILPFPSWVRTMYLRAATAQTIIIPTHIRLLMLLGPGPFYMTRDGNAEIPIDKSGGNPSAYDDPSITGFSFRAPTDKIWYVGGMRSISVISEQIANVQAIGWGTDRRSDPRAGLAGRPL